MDSISAMLAGMEPEDWQQVHAEALAAGDYESARLAAGFASGSQKRRDKSSSKLSRIWAREADRLREVQRGDREPKDFDY